MALTPFEQGFQALEMSNNVATIALSLIALRLLGFPVSPWGKESEW